jgi:hypothetical protein
MRTMTRPLLSTPPARTLEGSLEAPVCSTTC